MIDIIGVVTNALWIAGLAIVLAAFSRASFVAAQTRTRLRSQLDHPAFALPFSLGFVLFCLGVAFSSTRGWWESVLWLGLATAFAVQAWLADRQRRGRSSTARALLQTFTVGDRPAALTLIFLGVLLAATYAFTIRPWMQPDEPRHFEVIQHTARLGKLSVGFEDRRPDWEQAIIADMEAQSFWWYGFSMIGWDPNNLPQSFDEIWGSYFATMFIQQPLSYSVSAVVFRAWAEDLPLSQAVLVMRLFNVLLFAGALWGIYALLKLLLPEHPQIVLAALAFAALWPSHLTVAAAINNDIFVELTVIWMLYGLVRILRDGPAANMLFWVTILAVAAILAKRTGLIVVAALPLTLLLWAWGELWRRRSLKTMLLAGLLGAGAIAAAALLWRLAMTSGTLYRLSLQRLLDLLTPETFAGVPWQMFGDAFLRTFVGWFGWFRVPLPNAIYALGSGLLALAGAGLVLALISRSFRTWQGWQKRALLLLAALVVGQVLLVLGRDIIWEYWTRGAFPQARYLYAVIPAIALFLVLGWRQLIPRRWRSYGLTAGIALLVGFNIYVLGFVLYPFYWL